MEANAELRPLRILFVCTGNTCRSPMAEAIARRAVEKRGWRHVEVESAGISTVTGLPASEGARAAAGSRGVDLSGHESAQLTRERVERADLILVMTPSHRTAVEELGGGDKTLLLGALATGEDEEAGAAPVPDPFGGDEEVYRRTFDTPEYLVEQALTRIEPLASP